MDNRSIGDVFGGCGHKYSGEECSIPASINHDSSAIVYKASERSNQSPIHHNGSPVQKKRVSKIIGGGLRQISIIVCKKVESKGRTTYSEVADEVIAEFSETNNNSEVSLDKYEEKNVRRRVYDALNVLMALDIIVKERKEILWKGLPSADGKDMEQNKALHFKLVNRMGKKAAYLKELEEQIAGLHSLMLRNQQLLASGNTPSEGFSLPFIVVRTSPHATVEIEISEDMQLVHFDFNSTPFSLHDDAYILKLLRCYQLPESRRLSQNSSVLSSSSSDVASGGNQPFCWNSEVDTSK